MHRRSLISIHIPALVVVVATLIILESTAWSQFTQIIAATGDAAPDGNGTFSTFINPALNNAGQAAFSAELAGTSGGSTDDSGIFRGTGVAGPIQIAREGQAAPDGNGSFSTFIPPGLNTAGQVVFSAGLIGTNGGTSDDVGVFRGDGVAGPILIAREGQAAPGGNGTFVNLNATRPPINEAGQVAFSVTGLTGNGAGSSGGIYRGDGVAPPVLIAHGGQAPPDGNGIFALLHPANLSMNDAGQVSYHASLIGTSGGENSGIFRGHSVSGTVQIARAGQAAPDGDGIFAAFNAPAINNAGEVAFDASFFGPSGSTDRLFRADGLTAAVEVVREGQAVPGGNGSFFILDTSNLCFNDNGQVAFFSFLTGTSGGSSDDGGIYRGDGATAPLQIAREGQVSPDGNGSFMDIAERALNDAGQMAFLAALGATNGGTNDDIGLFFFTDGVGLLKVAREGDALLGSTITGLDFNPSFISSFSEERSGLNELGQVAYRFDLADGRHGVAVWTIPEPANVVFVGASCLALLVQRSVNGRHQGRTPLKPVLTR